MSESDRDLARLLAERKLVSEEVLAACLDELARGAEVTLGELLVRRGHLSPEHLQVTLRRETPASKPTRIRAAPAPPEVALAP